MSRTGQIFIGVLWLLGLVMGVVMTRVPHSLDLPSFVFSSLLVAGLALDLAIRPRSQDGRMAPLTMPERGAGVIGGAAIAVGVSAMLAPT